MTLAFTGTVDGDKMSVTFQPQGGSGGGLEDVEGHKETILGAAFGNRVTEAANDSDIILRSIRSR
jgi:hypothetical protein